MMAPLSRFALLLVSALSILSIGGCASTKPDTTSFYHVSILNRDGSLVAAWTARGQVIDAPDRMHRFVAVEHTVPSPLRTFRYPLGWLVTIGGPKTVIYRTEKPEWLRGLRPEDVADRAEMGGSSDGKTVVPPSEY